MADYGSLPSPTDRFSKPISSIFGSPRLFTGFASKNFIDTESVLSPTSILDHKSFSALRNSFFSDKPNTIKTPSHWDKLDSRGVGLGIVDELTNEMSEPNVSKPRTRMVLFGSQLKIQIPPLHPSVAESPKSQASFGIKTADSLFGFFKFWPRKLDFSEITSRFRHQDEEFSVWKTRTSPKSPADFGIKTRNSQSVSANPGQDFLSPSSEKKSPLGSENLAKENPNTPLVFPCSLSASEMELSEDYTCVILHGPNPRTTHIFDNCVVESCCGVVGISGARKGNGFCGNRSMSYPSENFLSFCYNCQNNLGQGKDIYMYRGEKAFCSSECRHMEMVLEEEGIAKIESLDGDDDDDDDIFRASP
ncbi:NAD(P)H-quinone oxidoreductase subunit, putative [Actinidia rufa]|uniref:NAD(P)H-quinone oxidoreductase subunit, putative n=1 Tax=Actinidia rufa TaxID=165716 RepID=A0A7J0HG32_9ERIC|nr:NAD(P)H-quinone oxidoreductase subunit, putative [Actinidia rufa]